MKTLAFILAIICIASHAKAQQITWHQTNGPFGAGSYQYVGLSNGGVALATDKRVYASRDGGVTWQANSNGLPSGSAQISAGQNGRLFATLNNALYVQDAIASPWLKLVIPDSSATQLLAVVEDTMGGILVNQLGAKPYHSIDHGKTWSLLNLVDSTYQVQAMAVANDQSFYLLTFGGNVFRSADGGKSWTKKMTINRDPARAQVIAVGNTVYVFGRNSAAYFSNDQGTSWKRITKSLPDSTISGFVSTPRGSWMVNAVSSKVIYRPTIGNYRTKDHGITWDSLGMIGRDLVADSSGVLYIANYNSTDDGNSWNPMTLNGVRDRAPNAIVEDSTHEVLVSMPNMGLFTTSDNGASFSFRALRAFGCFANGQDGKLYAGSRGVSYSLDRGRSWQRDSTNVHLLVSNCLSLISTNSGTLYTGCNEGIAYNYHPGDSAWDGPHGLIDQTPAFAMASNKSGQPFVMLPGGMFRLQPILAVWQPVPLTMNAPFKALAIDSSGRIFASTQDGKLYTSTDDGDSWDSSVLAVPRGSYIAQMIVTSNGNVFAGCAMDSGMAQGVLHFNRQLSQWEPANQGLLAGHTDLPTITLLGYAAGHIYVSTTDRGMFVDGSIEAVPQHSARALSLRSFPDPMQGAGSVEFALQARSNVRINLVDVLGREVQQIASGEYSTGEHSIRFTTGLPSGLYAIRFESDGKIVEKPLVVAR